MTTASISQSVSSHTEKDTGGSVSSGRSSVLLGWRITFGGLLFVGIVLVVGVSALNNDANLLFLLCGIGAGVALLNAIAPSWFVGRIEVERIIPPIAVASRPFKVQYVVRNRRCWMPAWSLVISEASVRGATRHFPQVFIPILSARKDQRLSATSQCPLRGKVELTGVRVSCRFPFGLFACSVVIPQPADLLVYPAVGRVRTDPWKRSRQAGTHPMQTNKTHSSGEEFFGVREYRPGDNLRWIHWRRSARVGELVVREMARMRVAQMTVMLDPWPEPSAGRRKYRPDAQVERLIASTASLICDALERGYRVGLIGRGKTVEVLAPAGGRPQRQRLLHALAMLQPGEAVPLETIVQRVRWSTAGQVRSLLCATRFDDSHQRLAEHLSRRTDALISLSAQEGLIDTLVELPVAGGTSA